MKPADRPLAGEDQAGQQGLVAQLLGQDLIEADGRPNLSSALRMHARQNARGPLGVPADDAGRVLQTVDVGQLFLDGRQGCKRRPQFHFAALAFGPPLGRMDAVAEEQQRKPLGRSVFRFAGFRGPEAAGLEPRQRHARGQAFQHHTPGNRIL